MKFLVVTFDSLTCKRERQTVEANTLRDVRERVEHAPKSILSITTGDVIPVDFGPEEGWQVQMKRNFATMANDFEKSHSEQPAPQVCSPC